MASEKKCSWIDNTTPLDFQLTNWRKGGTTPEDNVAIPRNQKTRTPGQDDDWILVPNADPLLNWFCVNNMALTSADKRHNLFI